MCRKPGCIHVSEGIYEAARCNSANPFVFDEAKATHAKGFGNVPTYSVLSASVDVPDQLQLELGLTSFFPEHLVPCAAPQDCCINGDDGEFSRERSRHSDFSRVDEESITLGARSPTAAPSCGEMPGIPTSPVTLLREFTLPRHRSLGRAARETRTSALGEVPQPLCSPRVRRDPGPVPDPEQAP